MVAASFWGVLGQPAQAIDPLASNNGLYPEEWQGRFHIANHDYPTSAGLNAWAFSDTADKLTPETAADYATRLKTHLEPTFRTLIETPENWDASAAGWYDMVWSGDGTLGAQGVDPTSGREALMNTYSGQIIPAKTFAPPYQPKTFVQNHAVVYYNSVAATMLGEVWENVYKPNIALIDFPDGSIVAKIEAVTNTPDNWNVLDGSAEWQVYRPTTEDQANNVTPLVPKVISARPFQIAIRVKDPIAAPDAGWVWVAYVYDATASGETPWERFVPIGVQWGNDPELTSDPSGLPAGQVLKETWVNADAPAFTHDSLGWGGRLSGPMDVATRHNVVTVSGQRFKDETALPASSCQSCHGAAEHPFTANLYPSPNRTFPRDDSQFLLYDPGSIPWARWFQNRPGTKAMSENIGGQGLDYDMVLMFALSAFNATVGEEGLAVQHFDGH